MRTMVPGSATDLQAYRVRLTREPAAAAQARGQVRAAICAWNAPVDADAAILLTSELVTNAVKHAAGGTVTLGIRGTRGQLRAGVHDTSPCLPVAAGVPAGAEAGRGLALVASLPAGWGCYHTPAGKVRICHARASGPRTMTCHGKTAYRPMPGARTGLAAELAREDAGRDAGNARGPCKRCGGRGNAHYLTCPLLRLPGEPEPAP